MSTKNQTVKTCLKCGANLPVEATAGLCPRCLLAAAVNDTTPDTMPMSSRLVPSQADLAPHFPQLEILECLGIGGMGVVFKARQKSLNRLVALKLLAPDRAGDALFAKRFAKEAQALAALNHPNIVTIHDFGQAGGYCYLLMEYVDGATLRQAMRAAKFTPAQALAVVPQICDALQYAHEHGVVHRDIKPENLLLDKEGHVKIADFGIAKMLNADADGTCATETIAGGTPRYTAPEQWEGRGTDHRADIYSLGVVFYELLTGELPSRPIDPPSKKVAIDVRLDSVVLHALEENPDRRYQTVAEVKTGVEAASVPARSKRTLTGLGIALAAACALTAVWTTLNRLKPTKPGTASQPTAHSLQSTASQGPFSYTTDNGAVTITKYTGPGGEVVVPKTIKGLPVASIGDNAFNRCTNLVNVTIPNSITNIGAQAFRACSGLTRISIPHSVAHIQKYAFAECVLIKTVTIPKSVISMDGNPFHGCSGLVALRVEAENPSYFHTLDGVVFDKGKTRLVCYPGGKVGGYAIPDGIASVGWDTFHGCVGLTDVVIPNSVTNIEWGSFLGCSGLTRLVIPNSVKSIGGCAFFGCTGLTNVTMPNALQSIEYASFCNCSALTTITFPECVTNIGRAAFYGCFSLRSVTIPENVSTIETHAFRKCSNLTCACFKGNAPANIDDNIFSGTPNVTVYHRPDITGWGKTFCGRPTAVWDGTTAGLPGNEKELDAGEEVPVGMVGGDLQTAKTQGPFTYTTTNGSVTITKYIGPGGDVTIPSMIDGLPVNSIGPAAFQNCTNLTGITIPNSVSTIGDRSFQRCYGLTSVIIPPSVTNLGFCAFQYCKSLTSATIADGITCIGFATFAECTRLSDVVIPDSVTRIVCGAFRRCALTTVTIPPNVVSIGNYAFADSPTLTDIYFQGDAARLEKDAFTHINTKATIYYRPGTKGWGPTFGGRPTAVWDGTTAGLPGSETELDIGEKVSIGMVGGDLQTAKTQGPFAYTTDNGAITITKYTGACQAVTIPDSLGGAPVRVVGHCAFLGSTELASITLPDSLRTINTWAFDLCPSLRSVHIPAGVKSIGSGAFAYCGSLVEISVDAHSATFSSMGGVLFDSAGSELVSYPAGKLGCYEIPNKVVSVRDWAFLGATNLPSVKIPAGVKLIGHNPFRGCSALTEITVDSASKFFRCIDGALYDAQGTTLLSCPGGRAGVYALSPSAVTIKDYAFWECRSLNSIVIPAGVTKVGTKAFRRCESLARIYFEGDAPELGDSAFSGTANATVYYRPGRKGWGPTFGGRPTAEWKP